VAEDSLTEVAFTLTEASQRVVLIEDFSNVSCNPCVTSNLILDALANGTYSRSKVAVVKYATNFPSPSDPFYTGSRTDCDARMSFYQILASPPQSWTEWIVPQAQIRRRSRLRSTTH